MLPSSGLIHLAFLLIILSFTSYAQETEECHEPKTSSANKGSDQTHHCDNPQYFHHYELERKNAFDPYILTPHKFTYFLPASYTNNVNKEAYSALGNFGNGLDQVEAKFQVSLKVPLSQETLMVEGDSLAFGFTVISWWQLYNADYSRPFKETNYQPELFYTAPLTWKPFGGSTKLVVGVEHQSNGKTQHLSRSWNRIYTVLTFAKDNYAISFRPWWRIPENKPKTTLTESGDDNPDISDYMGHFELTGAYKLNDFEFTFLGRRNFKESNGYTELGFTFPLSGRLKGYVQLSSGYGESLIDYNHSQQRVGVGIALTEIF